MRRYSGGMATVGVMWAVTGLARAQAPAPSVGASSAAAPAAAQDVMTAAEDVAVLKALAQVGLTRSQLAQALPALQDAQERLGALEREETAKLEARRSALEQAKRDLLAGKSGGAGAESQFALTQAAAVRSRARLRADLVSSLRRSLQTILTPAQRAQMAESGRAVSLSQRTASWRGGGSGGGNGGGPGGGMAGRLDRMREMSPADFEQNVNRMADRFGGRGSPQFQQYMSFMNNVRALPQSEYMLQRDQLAAQSLTAAGGPGGLAANDDEAITAFVERYLLSPRAPIVVRDRLRSQ